jgi:hypothetical protein
LLAVVALGGALLYRPMIVSQQGANEYTKSMVTALLEN